MTKTYPDQWPESAQHVQDLRERIEQALVLCRRHNGPHVTTPVQTLAGKVIAILEGKK